MTAGENVQKSEEGPRSRQRPTMTEKQLYTSVRNGQIISFHVFDAEPVQGYLAGMDTERFFVLEPYGPGRADFRKQFVARHGTGTPLFEIHSGSRLLEEPCAEEMDAIIRPFWEWVSINVVNQQGRRVRVGSQERNAS